MPTTFVRSLRAVAAAASLALFVAGCQLMTPTPEGTVTGTVVERKAGTAVAGTTVRVAEFRGLTTTTDADGSYVLEVPVGTWTLEFSQAGHAASRIEGVRVEEDATTHQDALQPRAFDPDVPATAPEVSVSLSEGDTVTGDADTDTFTFDVTVSVADASLLSPYVVTAGLGQSRGTSGYLNQFVPGQLVGFGEASMSVELSATGFDGATTLHVVAYDTNFNRTEVIVPVTVTSSREGAAPAPPSNLAGTAVTFNDVSVFGPLSAAPTVTGMQLASVLRSADLSGLAADAEPLPTASVDPEGLGDAAVQTQSRFEEVVTWVDLTFDYAFDSEDDLPTAFEVFRSTGGDFHMLGRISPFQAYLGGTTFGFRDATPSLDAGVATTYRIDAVTGSARESSEAFTLTPLPPFHVEAPSPANGAEFVSVDPTYEMTYRGAADEVFVGVLVFDRVHAEDNFLEWGIVGLDTSYDGLVPGLAVTLDGASIPHNVDGSASTDVLQAFHAYDWTPIAVTYTEDFSAIAVASDFYDFFGVGFGVTDGPWNTFVTGDGSF